jgi:hypothetical protein
MKLDIGSGRIESTTLFGVTDDEYRNNDGTVLRREHGETPNGNPLNGRWVLRNSKGLFIDFDRYRNDIAERNGLTLHISNLPPGTDSVR